MGLRDLPQRMQDKIQVTPDGHWIWTAGQTTTGYGKTTYKGLRTRKAHRVVYALLVGPVPDSLDLDHRCRIRLCVNPDCVEPVTRGENLLRSPLVGKYRSRWTECPRGHPFDEANTYRAPGTGKRACRACSHARDKYGTLEPA